MDSIGLRWGADQSSGVSINEKKNSMYGSGSCHESFACYAGECRDDF